MTTEQSNSAIGKVVHQLVFIMDSDETVLLSTLDPLKVTNIISSVNEHDKNIPNENDIEELEKWDKSHPLARWRKELVWGGNFSGFLRGDAGDTWPSWANFLTEGKYTLE